MHASNFRPVKNIPTIVEVFARLRPRYPVRLLMVGDGPELPAAEEQTRALGLQEHVHFVGAQEYLEDLLPLSDIFLLPSQHESFGLAALEAMSCGVAVVATNEGGTREVVQHGESGFVHAPDDVDGMVATISGLLDDPKQLERVGTEARRAAAQDFTVSAAVDRYLAVYERALSR
jgi:N-acetyl-alpha-D-glucosaminyl L-malate synthase BshA